MATLKMLKLASFFAYIILIDGWEARAGFLMGCITMGIQKPKIIIF